MKKLLCVILSFTLVFLCSCQRNSQEEKSINPNLNFTLKAQINYQETAFTAEIRSTESGCSAVFISPDELSGLEIEYNGTEFSYKLGELTFTSSVCKEISPFLKLFYDALHNSDYSIQKNESGYKIFSAINGYEYYLNISKEQYTPTYFEIESIGLNIKFGYHPIS